MAAVVFVAVAVVKPWDGGSSTLTAAPSPAVEPSPAAVELAPVVIPPTPAKLAEAWCNGTAQWMVYSYQRRGDQTFYVWTVTDPVPIATADPRTMPYTRVGGSQLMGFGYCAPAGDDLRPGAADPVTIWRVEDGITRPISAVPIAADLRTDFGALLRMSEAPTTRASAWPPGRYLIRAGSAVIGAEIVLS